MMMRVLLTSMALFFICVSGANEGKCGIAGTISVSTQEGQSSSSRIVGGTQSRPHAFPWLVDVYANGYQCGATLIRISDDVEETDVVITAQHCIAGPKDCEQTKNCEFYPKSSIEITAGQYDIDDQEDSEQISGIKGMYVPDLKNANNLYRDYAVLILEKKISFKDPYVRPACLPKGKDDDPPAGKMCIVTGWGDRTEGGKNGPSKPHEVALPITKECDGNESDICAGFPEGGKDSCQGDSGGPFVCEMEQGKWTLSGVVSRGDGCARAGSLGLYASVAYNLDFTKKTICQYSALKEKATFC